MRLCTTLENLDNIPDGETRKIINYTAGDGIVIDENNVISTTGSGTNNYNNLSNKPSINGVVLQGNKTSKDLGIYTPTTLYENANGSNSNITLSDNASNYEYMEIFYKNNDNAFSSVKVYQPNDKKVSLISHDNNARNTAWVKFTLVVISGNTIRFGNGVEIKLSAGSSITASSGNLNYITRVIGYK